MSIKLRSYRGRIEDFNTGARSELEFVTGQLLGSTKVGVDNISYGITQVGAADRVVEAGSDDRDIVLTGHGFQVGYAVRFKTGSMDELGQLIQISEIVDANTFRLDGTLSTDASAGDTFDVFQWTPQRFDATGASLASVITPPIQFVYDGVDTEVEEDTGTPANNRPLPVKLTSTSGDINITAGDLNVQLSHTTANYDSVRIGDGTELAAINASNELQVADDTARTSLSNIEGQLPATLGQKTMANSFAVVIASDQSALDVNDISGTVSLPTGASTEAKQDDIITELQSIDGKDFATETTLAALDAKFNSLGQKASAASAPVVLSSEQQTILDDMRTALQLLDNAVNGSNQLDVALADLGGAATEATLSSIDGKDFATETSLSSVDGKLPATLGQKTKAASLAVTLASDEDALGVSIQAPDGSTAGTASVATTVGTLTAPANAVKVFLQSDTDNGEFIRIGLQGADPSAAAGYQLLPGASLVLDTSQNIRHIHENAGGGGGTMNLNYIWLTRS